MNTINAGRKFRIVAAALAAGVVVAACGGSGGGGSANTAPSVPDPANMVPSSAVAYASVTIKPQGSMRSDLIEAIDSIAGKGSAQKLSASFEKSLGKKWKALKPWVGQQIGIALTALPASLAGGAQAFENDVLVVVPTKDPAAATSYLTKNVKSAGEAWNVVGHYAIIGGKNAVGRSEVTTPKTSLAADAGFKSDMAQLGSDELFSVYVPLHQLYEQLLPLLQRLPNHSEATALSTGAKQVPPGSSVAFGMAALHNQFRIDLIEHGTSTTTSTPTSAVPSDVSSLPGSAWLAITLGGALAKGSTVTQLTSNLSKELASIQALSGTVGSHVPSGPLSFVEQDLLPALGPAELAVSGTSLTTLQAGLVMAPDNTSAGGRLAKAVKHLVSGLPISSTSSGGRVAVTFGYSNLKQLLTPSSTLSGNPTFKQALAQLPAGAKADIYLNFAPITDLASLDPSAASAPAMKVLHRLDYLIAGGTHSHFRLVLATY
ncbi:MAG TPA: DUF3352 domain-containing protein [Solirubrobacteraceae bacterium]|nr:DUF3352 domain-containing protein [Solirubrobacteraceae bacterium]